LFYDRNSGILSECELNKLEELWKKSLLPQEK
jgi:hypothetical protein